MNKAVILTLAIGLSGLMGTLQAQVCSGNIGENIFSDGDFGSGTANLLTPDPMIAPGYAYTTNPPPSDGYYVLSNNLGSWGSLYPTWLPIGDNSTDPFGYMMVVNASFSPGLFYEQEVDGLCENTLYGFSADVINLIKPGVADHIDPNVSFLIDDVTQYSTGTIPKTGAWQTYGFTFTTEPGQTSVVLSLRNNAPGGIGNDLAIDNIEFRPCGPEALILPYEIENICADGSPIDLDATVVGEQYTDPAFQWQQSFDEGETWEDIPGANGPIYTHTNLSSGYYYYRYLLANGSGNLSNSKCRVNSNVKIVYVIPKFWEVTDTICQGLTYVVNDNSYNQTGVYVDSLLSSIGCDSIVTLNLTVAPDSGIEVEVTTQDPECAFTSNGNLSIEHVFNGAPPLTYLFDGGDYGGLTFYENLMAGDYTVNVVDRFGCSFEETYTIYDPPAFVVDAGNDVFVELGEAVTINPNSNFPVDTFFWLPDPPNNGSSSWDLQWSPKESVDLLLSAVSDKGCVAVDSVHIGVIRNRNVFIPNVFSPNDDGVNDAFTVFGAVPNVQRINKFMIFDRWGNLLFEQKDFLPNDESAGWNGRINGSIAPNGVYIYLAEILFFDDEVEEFTGNVMLAK